MPVERGVRGLALLASAASLMGMAGQAAALPAPETLAACVACHGPGGNAQTAQMPTLAGQPRIFIENQLVLMREGLREVPQMQDVVAGLTDADIIALASHFAAQAPLPRSSPRQAEKYRLGAQLSADRLCGTCHLGDYRGQQQVPRLAGQDEAYLLHSMTQFRDRPGPGRDTIMAAALHGLGDADLVNLAHYLSQYRP